MRWERRAGERGKNRGRGREKWRGRAEVGGVNSGGR